MNMKYFNLSLFLMLLMFTSCNAEWTDEQFEQYVSIKAPINSNSVSRLRLKYKNDGKVTYKLPLLVSGSTVNNKNITAYVGLDVDTMNIFNKEHFYDRRSLYFKLLDEKYYSIKNPVVSIPAGENQGLMDIEFDFKDIDLVDKLMLPLKVLDDPSYNYVSNPIKNYNNGLLWITPFNDYSGSYGATNVTMKINGTGNPLVVTTREAYVVSENEVFFYAGAIEESRADRGMFKIKMRFEPSSDRLKGAVYFSAYDDRIKFSSAQNGTYQIVELMDPQKPSLMRRNITVSVDYSFVDPNSTPGYEITYTVKGTMSMQRNINTLIPDEEFAIEW